MTNRTPAAGDSDAYRKRRTADSDAHCSRLLRPPLGLEMQHAHLAALGKLHWRQLSRNALAAARIPVARQPLATGREAPAETRAGLGRRGRIRLPGGKTLG